MTSNSPMLQERGKFAVAVGLNEMKRLQIHTVLQITFTLVRVTLITLFIFMLCYHGFTSLLAIVWLGFIIH